MCKNRYFTISVMQYTWWSLVSIQDIIHRWNFMALWVIDFSRLRGRDTICVLNVFRGHLVSITNKKSENYRIF